MGGDLGGVEFYTGPPVLGGQDDLDEVVRSFTAAGAASPGRDSRQASHSALRTIK